MTQRITTDDFINRARQVHGNEYNYERVNYVNSRIKVEIICLEHGSFWQTSDGHLHRKNKCPRCARRSAANKKRKSIQQFIAEAMEVHGDRYDYREVDYKNSGTKVKIICPDHGPFWQCPRHHFAGRAGCEQCKKKSTTQFVSEALDIHGEQYDYSQVEYVKAHAKVKIICPEHGPFWQWPTNHLQGK